MSGETIDIYIPQLGEVRYNALSKDIEVAIDGAWVPIWRIGNIQQLPMSIVMQIGRIAENESPETLSYRSAVALSTLAGPATEPDDFVLFPQGDESCSSSASSTPSAHSSSSMYMESENCYHIPGCTCSVCTNIRDVSRIERERIRRAMEIRDPKVEEINNQYQDGEVGKYDRTISYSKPRKLMLP